MRLITLSLLFTLSSGLAHASSRVCDLGDIAFDNRFPGASSDKMIASCSIDETGLNAKMHLQPEDVPINDSPWYAFKLSSKQPRHLNMALEVQDGNNRYPPKGSYDGRHWQSLAHEFKDKQLTFSVRVDERPVWIAAQELITAEDYANWRKQVLKKPFVEQYQVSTSIEERPVYALEAKQSKGANKWLVVLGRMHPPELTGAMAFFPFANTLLADSELAKRFRQSYNIFFVPNINPDGVALGHWRHNLGGLDLNRDWINFSQPEVKGVHQRLQDIVKAGGKMDMAVDFHSTNKNVFYTMPSDYGLEHPKLVEHWLSALDKRLNTDFVVLPQPGTSPGRGVFKQYFADTYKVHAITYEMGDNTNRQVIDIVAKEAATTLMESLLNKGK